MILKTFFPFSSLRLIPYATNAVKPTSIAGPVRHRKTVISSPCQMRSSETITL